MAEFLKNMAASADVLAMAKVEVDLAAVPEGKNVSWIREISTSIACRASLTLSHFLQVIIKWRGKPVFIRHRTEAEIAEANKVNVSSLRDPQEDGDRVKKPEWLVMLGKNRPRPRSYAFVECYCGSPGDIIWKQKW